MKVFGLRPALAMGFLLFAAGALALILMPVTSSHRPAASRAQCMSNLKQLGLGSIMYTVDYDSWYPPAEWKPAIAPYLPKEDFYRCPQVPKGSSGYAYNRLVAGRRLPESKGLGKIPMLFESNDLRMGAIADRMEPLRPQRHEDRINLVLADGHAKRITFLGIRNVQTDPDIALKN